MNGNDAEIDVSPAALRVGQPRKRCVRRCLRGRRKTRRCAAVGATMKRKGGGTAERVKGKGPDHWTEQEDETEKKKRKWIRENKNEGRKRRGKKELVLGHGSHRKGKKTSEKKLAVAKSKKRKATKKKGENPEGVWIQGNERQG